MWLPTPYVLITLNSIDQIADLTRKMLPDAMLTIAHGPYTVTAKLMVPPGPAFEATCFGSGPSVEARARFVALMRSAIHVSNQSPSPSLQPEMQRARSPDPITTIQAFDLERFLRHYSFRLGGGYKPTTGEKLLLEDAIMNAFEELKPLFLDAALDQARDIAELKACLWPLAVIGAQIQPIPVRRSQTMLESITEGHCRRAFHVITRSR